MGPIGFLGTWVQTTILCSVTSQKSAYLIVTATEASNHVLYERKQEDGN